MAHHLLLLAAAATALVAPSPRQSPRAAALQAKKTVFIDGEAGTTGLQVLDRLATHPDIEVLSIDPAKRKDAAARKEAIAEADTLLLTVPNMLGVEYNVHVLDAILKHVAPALGWR